MNPTGSTQETEFVLRRLGDAAPHSLPQLFLDSEVARSLPLVLTITSAVLLLVLLVEFLLTRRQPVQKRESYDLAGWLRWTGVAILCVASFAVQRYVPRLIDFNYSPLIAWPPVWHPWVELCTCLIPAILCVLPALVYVPAFSQESLKHHNPSRAILRAFAGTACYLALIAFLDNFFREDTSALKTGASSPAAAGWQTAFWLGLTGTVLTLAILFTYVNYVRDLGWRSPLHWALVAFGLIFLYAVLGGGLTGFTFLNREITGELASWTSLFLAAALAVPALVLVAFPFVPKSMNVFWAVALSALRINVYAILAAIFLLPSCQTWERTEKKSRVIMLIDVSPSMQLSDDIAAEPGTKTKTRIEKVIDLLTDDKIALIQKLTEQNPVYVYRFGTRLDDETHAFAKGDANWAKAEWDAFTKYDFRAWLLTGLSDVGKEQLRGTASFSSEGAGTPDWAMDWVKKPEAETTPAGMSEADMAVLTANRGKLEKRVDVARSIVLGTNVPDSITGAINRESSNMAQGVIVITDGRSNLGSDSAITELKDRATREQIPVFTIAVGEDRQTVAITITDIVAPDRAPPDDAFKIIVEADGTNLANQTVEVKLGLFLPSRDPKKDAPDHELTANLTFPTGDPPHGSVEFVIDPTKLPDALTETVKGPSGPKRQLKEGPWSAVARIAKDRREVFAAKEHIRERSGIQVLNRPLRILLVTSGPLREYQTIRDMLVRETKENRVELSILVQTEAGQKGDAVQGVPPERMLTRFPNILDTSGNTRVEDKFYNLNEYDLILAFDPDWGDVSEEAIKNLHNWVNNLGGGFILVADNHNTFQLARAESNSRLSPILELLPVIPDDIIVQSVRPIPRVPRRLVFQPPKDSDLLRLSDDPANPDPTAGWEMFFTRREKYVPNEDKLRDLSPPRGIFRAYPVKMVKPGAAVLAELADIDEKGEEARHPWLVVTQPARGRTAYIASPELYRLRALDPDLGPEYHQRFWINLTRYIAANRDAKAARGRVLLNKEYISGSPIRLQARLLSPTGKPYAPGEQEIKAEILPLNSAGDRLEREDPVTKQKVKLVYGPYTMAAKKGAGEFDGYYQTEVTADARLFPPGDNRYRVVVKVPESPGETIESEFMIRKSDPELDRRQPDFAAMLAMASEFDAGVQSRVTDASARERLLTGLKKEGGRPKLAFQLAEPDLIKLIPSCMKAEERNYRNRGAIQDLWDRPAYVTLFQQEIRLLDFDLTRDRVRFVLIYLFATGVGLMIVRGIWEAISAYLPTIAANTIAVLWVALQLGATLFGFFGVESLAGTLDPEDMDVLRDWSAWLCVLNLALVFWTVMVCRLNVGPAYIVLGLQLVLSGLAFVLFALFANQDFHYHAEVGVALLAIVGLLSTEWLTRKLLRLA